MVVMRQDKAVEDIKDLCGKTVLLPRSVSGNHPPFCKPPLHHCRNPFRKHCEVKMVNDPDDALDQVVDGQADPRLSKSTSGKASKRTNPSLESIEGYPGLGTVSPPPSSHSFLGT